MSFRRATNSLSAPQHSLSRIFPSLRRALLSIIALALLLSCSPNVAAQTEIASVKKSQLTEVVREAFKATHAGYSSDEVILKSELNDAFIKACQAKLPSIKARQFNWALLNLRKAGKLDVKASKRDTQKFDGELPIAEICSRMMEDKHGESIDRLMADPKTQSEFNAAAKAINEDVDTYLVRKAAFRLRKTRRLRPELITRIADWGRVVQQHSATKVQSDFDLIPESAGIYLFHNAKGYLYIGEAVDLRARLKQHFDESDNKSLGNYLKEQGYEGLTIEIHSFEKGSRIDELMVRRAYESELIRSRKPKFNIRP